jgi:hypothetical protein
MHKPENILFTKVQVVSNKLKKDQWQNFLNTSIFFANVSLPVRKLFRIPEPCKQILKRTTQDDVEVGLPVCRKMIS